MLPIPPGRIRDSTLLGLALSACLAGSLHAGQLDDQINAQVKGSRAADGIPIHRQADVKGGDFVVAPVPIVDPTVGTGLAGVTLYTFDTEDADSDTPRSTIGGAVAYTDEKSWMAGAGTQLFLAEDRYRIRAIGGYGNLNLDYYGTSSASYFFKNPVGFNIRGSVFDIRAQRRIAENFYAGLTARRIDASVALNAPIDIFSGLDLGFNTTGLGVIGSYDTRDDTWYPTHGTIGSVTVTRFASDLLFDQIFTAFDTDASHYWTLTDNLVLAGDARAAYSGDETPFFMLPYINFRGFPAGQYLNNAVVQAQTEIRWKIAGDFGVVAFGGIGVAASSFSDLGGGSNAYGLGIGMRYQLSEVDKMNLGFDVAYGSNEDVALYFHIGEAF